MVILLTLLIASALPMGIYFLMPPSSRHGAAYILPTLSVIVFTASIVLIVAVNLGWLRP
jgi:hypothetical protein